MRKILAIAVATSALAVPFVAFAQFDTDLHYGSTGSDVIALQEFLTQQNVYSGPISGNFYSLTLAGVKKFQTAESIIPISGYVGPVTRSEINQILAGQVSSSEGNATTTQAPVDLSQQASTTTQSTSSSLIQSLLAQLSALNDKINSLQQTQQQMASSTQAMAQNTQQIAQNTTPARTTPTSESTQTSQTVPTTPPPCVPNPSMSVTDVGPQGGGSSYGGEVTYSTGCPVDTSETWELDFPEFIWENTSQIGVNGDTIPTDSQTGQPAGRVQEVMTPDGSGTTTQEILEVPQKRFGTLNKTGICNSGTAWCGDINTAEGLGNLPTDANGSIEPVTINFTFTVGTTTQTFPFTVTQ